VSKYDPLTKYLMSQPAGVPITLTFAQLQRILGFTLPRSACVHPAWWANETNPATRHRHCLSWLGAGRKASANLNRQIATFT